MKPVWSHEAVHVLVTLRDGETCRPCIPGAQPHINQWITTSRAGLVAKLLALSREFTHRPAPPEVQVLKSVLIIYHIYSYNMIYIYIERERDNVMSYITCWLPKSTQCHKPSIWGWNPTHYMVILEIFGDGVLLALPHECDLYMIYIIYKYNMYIFHGSGCHDSQSFPHG